MQSFPKCGPQTSVALLWVLLFSFRWRINLNSGRQESMLQGRQRGEDGIWLVRGQYYLVLSYCFLFLQYFHNRIDLFSALSLTVSLRSPTVLSPGYRKPRALLGVAVATQRKQKCGQKQPRSASGPAISFHSFFLPVSQHLSLPLSFDPVLLSHQVSLWLFFFFFFSRWFLSQLQLFFTPFIYVATSPPRTCLDFCQHSFLIFS